jgi:hypothetical protein
MDENSKKIYDILQDVFKNVWEQQKYAELKNGVMLTLNIAIFAIIGRTYLSLNDIFNCEKAYNLMFIGLLFLFVIHILIIVLSYFPKDTNKEDIKWTNDEINIFFYGDIRKLQSESYLKLLQEKIKISGDINKSILLDLANQLIILSKITQNKYNAFKNSIYRFFILIICFVFFTVFTIFNYWS